MKAVTLILFLSLFYLPGYSQQLSLQQCIDSAIQKNYNVRIAGYDVLQTQSKIAEAKANLLPKVNTALDYRYYTNLPYQLLPAAVFGGAAGKYKEAQFGVPHNINANVQLIYPLYNPVIKANIKSIEAAEEVAKTQHTKSQEDVVAEVSNVYYNAQILVNQLSFIDSNIANSNKLLAVMNLLHEQKMAKRTDAEKVNLQLAQLFTQKDLVESQYEQAINILQFLMGKSQDEEIGIESNPADEQKFLLIEKPLTEVTLIEKQIVFLQTEKTAIVKSKLPVVNLNAFYGATGFANTGSSDYFKFFPLGYAGVQVMMPLYTGNSTKRKLETKEIEIGKAALKLEMIKEKNKVDIINNGYQLSAAKKNLQTIKQQIQLAQNIYTSTLLQQKEGVATLTDVLLADNAIREAQQNYIAGLITLRRAELENKKLTGNLLIN